MSLAVADSSTDVRPNAGTATAVTSSASSGGHGFSFKDFLDTINPLQHIPVVETIYRRVTGDEISHAARIAGDALYGGPVGLLGGYLNTKVMGKDSGASGTTEIAATSSPQPGQITAANEAGISPNSVTLSALPQHASTGIARSATSIIPQVQAVATAAPAPAAVTPPAYAPAASAQAAATASMTTIPTSAMQGIPIDMSPRGLMVMQGRAREHSPVPLDIPAGQLSVDHPTYNGNSPNTVSAADFQQRMQDGLNKYRAVLMARQKSGGTVDPAAAVTAPSAPMSATLQ